MIRKALVAISLFLAIVTFILCGVSWIFPTVNAFRYGSVFDAPPEFLIPKDRAISIFLSRGLLTLHHGVYNIEDAEMPLGLQEKKDFDLIPGFHFTSLITAMGNFRRGPAPLRGGKVVTVILDSRGFAARLELLFFLLASYPFFALARAIPRLRRERRRKKGLCIHCGYNLTGNESGVCPECGERI